MAFRVTVRNFLVLSEYHIAYPSAHPNHPKVSRGTRPTLENFSVNYRTLCMMGWAIFYCYLQQIVRPNGKIIPPFWARYRRTSFDNTFLWWSGRPNYFVQAHYVPKYPMETNWHFSTSNHGNTTPWSRPGSESLMMIRAGPDIWIAQARPQIWNGLLRGWAVWDCGDRGQMKQVWNSVWSVLVHKQSISEPLLVEALAARASLEFAMVLWNWGWTILL